MGCSAPGSRAKEVEAEPADDAGGCGGAWNKLRVPAAGGFDFDAAWLKQQAGETSGTKIHLVDDAREAFYYARASVVASGTATVQAAVIGNPLSSSIGYLT